MVIIALGPLTNIAGVLRSHPALATQVQRIIAVMGQRPGHVFHPVEGGTARILFGHRPVFQDFNFAKNHSAVTELLSLGLPMTWVPYEAAQKMTIPAADLDTMDRDGVAARWVTGRSREWLSFWRDDIHQQGFFVRSGSSGLPASSRAIPLRSDMAKDRQTFVVLALGAWRYRALRRSTTRRRAGLADHLLSKPKQLSCTTRFSLI